MGWILLEKGGGNNRKLKNGLGICGLKMKERVGVLRMDVKPPRCRMGRRSA